MKKRVVTLWLNMIRLGERGRDSRDSEKEGIERGIEAQLISQPAPVEVPAKSSPTCEAQPAKVKEKKKKKKAKKGAREVDPNLASEDEGDNHHYLTVEIEERSFRGLFDPGATCSLIRPALAKHFAALLLPSNSQIQALNGSVSKIAGVLPATLEIDGIEGQIECMAVPEVHQEMLLGTDFCKVFRISVMQFKGL